MVFLWSFAPATADIPVYEALRADLAASGDDALQLENLKASPMRSWIGLYALLYMLREAGTTEFTGPAITEVLQASGPVPMLDMFGGEDWEPNLDHPGVYTRAGIDRWATYRWDPSAEAPEGLEGNWVEASDHQLRRRNVRLHPRGPGSLLTEPIEATRHRAEQLTSRREDTCRRSSSS